MADALSFAIGVESSGFVRGVDKASGTVKNFLGTAAKITGITLLTAAAERAFQSLGNVVQGVESVIGKGAGLEYLHRRTGETVRDLFLLQRGFSAVGLSSDDVGEMIFHLQKSLGGVNEAGETTLDVFSMLGLNLNQMRDANAPDQFMRIVAAINSLDPTRAAAASEKIFGRGGAANFLQIARASGEFSQALQDNIERAERMARLAPVFEQVHRSVQRLSGKGQDFFMGIAEGVLPAIQDALKMLNSIDLSKIGKDIGHILGGLVEAFKSGTLTETIFLAIYTGFEMAWAAIPGLVLKLGDMLLHVFTTPLNYLQATMEYIIQRLMADATMLHINKALGLPELQPQNMQSFAEILEEQKKTGPKFNFGFGEYGTKEIDAKVDEIRKSGNAKAAQLLEAFLSSLKNKDVKGGPDERSRGNAPLTGAKPFEATSLEKLGFIFNAGGPTVLHDAAKQTAANTARIAHGIDLLVNRHKNAPSTGHDFLKNNLP